MQCAQRVHDHLLLLFEFVFRCVRIWISCFGCSMTTELLFVRNSFNDPFYKQNDIAGADCWVYRLRIPHHYLQYIYSGQSAHAKSDKILSYKSCRETQTNWIVSMRRYRGNYFQTLWFPWLRIARLSIYVDCGIATKKYKSLAYLHTKRTNQSACM